MLNETLKRGQIQAALNFWQYNARLDSAAFTELIKVEDMLPAIGLPADMPLLGWVFSERWAKANPLALTGYLAAAADARRLLANSPAEWQAIRTMTGAADDATLEKLRAAYRRGIVTSVPAAAELRRRSAAHGRPAHRNWRRRRGTARRHRAARHLLRRRRLLSWVFMGLVRVPLSETGLRLLSALLLLALWQAAALSGSTVLPGPVLVARTLIEDATEGCLLSDLGYTLARVGAAFAVAMAAGSAIGMLMGRSRSVDGLFDLWLVLGLNVPALVIIYLCYLWIGLDEAAAVAAVALNKVAQTAVILREGARSLDTSLLQVAEVLRLPWGRKMRRAYLPQLYPVFHGGDALGPVADLEDRAAWSNWSAAPTASASVSASISNFSTSPTSWPIRQASSRSCWRSKAW